jgi:hypothetical protein
VTATVQAVGLRQRSGITTALDGLDLPPSWGRSWPCSARPRTSELKRTPGVHAHAQAVRRDHHTVEGQGG